MKKMLIVLLLFGTVFLCFAGEPESELDPVAINLAYYTTGLLTPGMLLGIDVPLLGNKYNCMYSATNAGIAVQRYIRIPVFVYTELGYRFTFRFGLNFHTALGAGYKYSILYGDVYEIVDGRPTLVSGAGNSLLMVSYLLGVGWNFNKDEDFPLDVFLRLQMGYDYSVNSMPLSISAVQLGIRYFLN